MAGRNAPGREIGVIRNLVAVAVFALIAFPLVSLNQLGGVDGRASLSVVRDGGGVVYVIETRAAVRLEPLLASIL